VLLCYGLLHLYSQVDCPAQCFIFEPCLLASVPDMSYPDHHLLQTAEVIRNNIQWWTTGVLCAKASMLLQVSFMASSLFLREHRSQWADNALDAFFASALKPIFCNLSMSNLRGFSCQVILL
jgi:hypothetical protein